MKRKAKNLYFIEKKLIKYNFLVLFFVVVLLMIYHKYDIIYFVLLGSFFSFLIMHNMIDSQNAVLIYGNARHFFIRFVMRFFLYGIPVYAGLKIDHLKLPIILISLFTFQTGLLTITILRGLRKIRRL
ncbi:MAG: hypothetical protein GY730_08395 [bacterium]|nr:hypothetical protein [bacterium]